MGNRISFFFLFLFYKTDIFQKKTAERKKTHQIFFSIFPPLFLYLNPNNLFPFRNILSLILLSNKNLMNPEPKNPKRYVKNGMWNRPGKKISCGVGMGKYVTYFPYLVSFGSPETNKSVFYSYTHFRPLNYFYAHIFGPTNDLSTRFCMLQPQPIFGVITSKLER